MVKGAKMITSMRLLGLAVALLLMFGLTGASEYEFGTRVLAQDSDIGRALYDFPFADIMYWDIGPNPTIYDEGDVLYLIRLTATVVTSNDVRITPFESYAAGTKVTANNKDIDMPLSPFPIIAHNIVFLDLFGSTAFDLKDPVYFHRVAAPNIVTNDVRLTNVTGHAPGTKVIDFDPDHDKPWVLLQPLPTIPLFNLIKYFDANGNGVYDYPDDVYLIYPLGGPPFSPHVRVNSIRLSGPV